MVAAYVSMETGIEAIHDEFVKKVRSSFDPTSPSLLAERRLNHDCSHFIYTRFYAKFHALKHDEFRLGYNLSF
jgi:hypothetical protein